MTKYLFSRRLLGVGIVISALAMLPVQAASASDATSSCPEPSVSQPFLALGDSSWYTLAPGESADNFDGTGWILTGGASIVSTTLAHGTTGSVLDLPPGSSATSPSMCVSTGYPLARMFAQTLGSRPTNAVKFYVSSAGSKVLGPGMPVLGTPTWSLTPPVNVAPGNSAAEQVDFTFVSNANTDVQIYDLNVDPRMKA